MRSRPRGGKACTYSNRGGVRTPFLSLDRGGGAVEVVVTSA
jgi:hypothetical protein